MDLARRADGEQEHRQHRGGEVDRHAHPSHQAEQRQQADSHLEQGEPGRGHPAESEPEDQPHQHERERDQSEPQAFRGLAQPGRRNAEIGQDVAPQQGLGRRRAYHLDPVAAFRRGRRHRPHPPIEGDPVHAWRHADHHRGATPALAGQQAVPDADAGEVGAQLGDRDGIRGERVEQGPPLESAGVKAEAAFGGEADDAARADAVETGQVRRQLPNPAEGPRPEDPLGAVRPHHHGQRIADAEPPAHLPVVDGRRCLRGDQRSAVHPQPQTGEAGHRRHRHEGDGGQRPAGTAEGGPGERVHTAGRVY
jgi:hypothetical protein